MEEYKLNNEEKLLVLGTLHNYPNIESYISEKIQFHDLKEEKLLYMMNTNYYKLRTLFFYNMKKYGMLDRLPVGVCSFLENKTVTSEDYQKKMEEIKKISYALSQRKIKHAIIKGIGVAETVYSENPYIRDFNDIDILVLENNAEETYQYLIKNLGYTCAATQNEQILYKKMFQHYAPISKEKMRIELHHRLTQKNDKYSIDTNEIIENAVFIKKENACIPITNREDTLLNLCYHMFQHEYRETRYQLKCHSDIFNFLYYYRKELNWVCFWDNVRKNNLEFPVSYALYHVNLLYENVLGMNIVPVEILEKIVTDNFKEKKDWVISRHLLNNDEPIGIWEQSYLERLFMDTKTVRTELCKIHFFYSCRKEWEKECEKMKISFEEGFKFTPEAWKALGRI